MTATAINTAAQDLSGKRALVVGLGKTGLSCAHYLHRCGAEVAVTDSRSDPPGLLDLRERLPDVAVFVGGFAADAFARSDLVVLSPGVPVREPLVQEALQRGVEVVGDIELFARAADAPVVAITGSNGKSTVTTLVGEMARACGWSVRVGGNLGTPALDLLAEQAPQLYVLELSSFQLETTRSLNAIAAVVLNVSADHMDRYDSLQEYAAAKAHIFTGGGALVVNADDPVVMGMLAGIDPKRRVLRFSLTSAEGDTYGVHTVNGRTWLCQGGSDILPVDELRIAGLHNVANALAALALGDAAGLEREATLQTLRSFPGLPHRSQWVADIDGVAWYDDSKGTNVGATLAALQGIPGDKVVLIAGGLGKGADFTPLRAPLLQRGRALVLIGQDAAAIAAAVADAVPVLTATTMEEAVAEARRLAMPGDCVLLSPACASFDMFRNYEHRGEVFCQAVRGLAQ
ncbi:MAG: UDP-N-acetylmuramoylalanine--D-glutamate ligase [Thiotrichales bacterium SG8_50]|nr:MAG: UDP-N-acetylmuramoylalanine--D-glutamate ligase [Thiotrichales bacterium SG8_50]